MKNFPSFLIFLAFVSGCAPARTQTTPSVQLVNVYATATTGPWLTKLFECAANTSVTLNITDADSADLVLRIGEPKNLTTPAYQIDSEEILVVTHRESPVQNLSLEEIRALFMGQGNPSVQVWVYPSEEDIQQIFNQLVMAGRSVTSSAKVATSPQRMSDLINAEESAVGILPKHWKAGEARIVFNAGNVPVLAVLKSEPEGALRGLLACLQK